MSFFTLLWKARTIEKYRLNYEREKINSMVNSNTPIEKTLMQKWRHYRYDTQKRISKTFKKLYPDGSGVSNFILYLKTDQTFPNFLLKSVMGFVGGIILTYLCFMFFVFQLSISLIHATIMSSTIGVLLTLGLAFSYRIRCLVFLLIPQLFSRVGRYTLTCYALVLILTGPATNTLKNSEVLTESMACSQEQIKLSVHKINNCFKKPFNSMKDSIKLMIEKLQHITNIMKEAVLKTSRLILSIVSVLHSSFKWLKSIADVCNSQLGTPYERCINVLKNGAADCKGVLGVRYNWLCDVIYVANIACGTAKPFTSFCGEPQLVDETIVATIKRKLKTLTEHIRSLFRLEIHIQQTHSFSSNGSRSAGQVAAGIVTEIRTKADLLLTWLSWSSCVTSLFLVLIIFRAKYYQHMYETRSRFDNRYITKDFQELDLKRQRQGRETVLPLNRRERTKYITTTSFRLVASEKVNMNRSVVFMVITTVKLLIHMTADYSLYWVLMTIRYHGRFQSYSISGVPETGAHVTGNGFIARLFRSIVSTLDIPLSQAAVTPMSCLPNPYPPDFRRYAQIGVLIVLLWLFALFEPYGLRLRHLVMDQYRPERAKARASWLYYHILRTRDRYEEPFIGVASLYTSLCLQDTDEKVTFNSTQIYLLNTKRRLAQACNVSIRKHTAGFMKFARRKLHREYKYSSEGQLTFRQWISDHIPFQWLKYLLGVCPPEPRCLLCGLQHRSNDPNTRLTRCESPSCAGVYCANCYSDISRLCTLCLAPADYGALSDVSLEKGSSDESGDSEEEFDNIRRHPADQQKPYTRLKIHEDNNYTKSYEMGKCTSSTEIYYYKEKKPIAKNEILNALLDENNNVVANLICKEVANDLLFKDNENIIFRNTHDNKVVNNVNGTKIVTNCKIKTASYKLNLYSNKRHVSRPHYYDLNKIFKKIKKHKLNNIRGVIKINNEKSFATIGRYFMENSETNENTKQKNKIEPNQPNRTDIKETKLINRGDPRKQKDNKTLNNKHKKIKKLQSDSKLQINNSREKIADFHAFFSKHWRTIKFSLLPCIMNNQVKKTDQSNKDRKNYKSRKKLSCLIEARESAAVINKEKQDNKLARSYRISAFLADLDWTKRDYRKDNKKHGDSLLQNTEGLSKLNNNKPSTIVAMVQVKTPSTQWDRLSKNDPCRCCDIKCTCPKVYSPLRVSVPITKEKSFAQKALKRFRNKVKLLCSSSNMLTVKIDKTNSETVASIIKNEDNSELLFRRLNYYHSITKDESQLGNQAIDKGATKCITKSELALRGLNSIPNIKTNTSTANVYEYVPNTTRNIAVSRSKITQQKNKSTYVYKKKNTTGTQDTRKTIDAGQEAELHKSIERELDRASQSVETPLKNKLSIMREFYSSIFGSSNKEDTAGGTKQTAEKSTIVEPDVKVIGCQYSRCKCRNKSTQYGDIDSNKYIRYFGDKIVCDAAIEVARKTCTCATQHVLLSRNMATMHCPHPLCKRFHDAAVQYQRKIFYNAFENKKEAISNETPETSSTNSTKSSSSTKTDETKTDTTVCSLATVDYNEPTKRTKKYSVKVVTKANQSTLTDKTERHDMSTCTNDWWSPLLERKTYKQMLPLKENKEYVMREKQRQHGKCKRRSKGVETDGKFVSFKSRTQVIPTGMNDVMSPSRYLLESQKYYNELFSYKFSPAQVYSVSQGSKYHEKRSPVGSRRSHSRKTKRLEECYSPRKQMSSKKRRGDCVKRCDSPRWRQPTQLSRSKNKQP